MTLPGLFRKYHHVSFLANDPLCVVHRFKDPGNIETAGLIAASLAYGRVEQINKSLSALLKITGNDVCDFILKVPFPEKRRAFKGFKHRFNDGDDIALLLEVIRRMRETHDTLEGFFLKRYKTTDPNIKPALDAFSTGFRNAGKRLSGRPRKTFDFLFPTPLSGSACKRLNMYLRWMVRKKDGVDFGLWKSVSPAKLVVPVDTHVAACGRRLHFTRRKQADWTMAEEITEQLKKYDPEDPVKYDFAICSAGKAAFRE